VRCLGFYPSARTSAQALAATRTRRQVHALESSAKKKKKEKKKKGEKKTRRNEVVRLAPRARGKKDAVESL
jgi:hypothetical protein